MRRERGSVVEVRRLWGDERDAPTLRAAAACLLDGGLVAFPTETVYGLGALALDEAAAARIFVAKGRPAEDPLIVHIHERRQIAGLVREIPPLAERLMDAFWPGPLTLVLAKSAAVPSIISAGGATVAIRLPAAASARAFLRAVGVPVAAPSANRFGRISPTRSEHVLAELGGRIDWLLDGGPTGYGLESTVVDLTQEPARILRPGAITLERLRRLSPEIQVARRENMSPSAVPLRAPGQLPAHYAPRTELRLLRGPAAQQRLARECHQHRAAGRRIGLLLLTEDEEGLASLADTAVELGSEQDLATCARSLYHQLRQLDERGLDIILARELPNWGLGRAINDRLRRAAAGSPSAG